MDHNKVHKLIKAAALSLLVLTTTSGVASLEVMAAGPVMAQPAGPGGDSAQGTGSDQPDPTSTPTPTPVPVPAPVPTLPAP